MRFDRRASDYSRHALPQAEVVRRFAQLIPAASGTVDALELGAGTGLLTRELLAKGYSVRATDLSPAMLAVGRSTLPDARWETLDADHPRVACCDRLFSSGVLQWSVDPVATLARHRKALRPGGILAHALFIHPTLCELRELAGDAMPVIRRDAAFWLDAAREAGLRITRSETVVLPRVYKDGHALLREIHGTGAVAGRASFGAGTLRTLLREYDRRFAAPGGVTATWAALLFEAVAGA